LFALSDLGVDAVRFLTELHPTFGQLPWDEYDVRREQLRIIEGYVNEAGVAFDQAAAAYYTGQIPIESLGHWLERLPPDVESRVRNFEPFRRRAAASFDLMASGDAWLIHRRPSDSFRQAVHDYRSEPRLFAPMPDFVSDHPELQTLITGVANLVRSSGVAARQLKIIVHQISCVARATHPATNSPEGIHQDGSSFIVSALVVSRTSIRGGISTVYGADRRTPLISVCLAPGQGLFHADAGSDLWHEVSPIEVEDGVTVAARNILGFDIHVVD
jgi:hypothetical protein